MLGVLLGLPAGGCAGHTPGPVDIPAGRYTAAFEAAKESLREAHFGLERVDAASGVITTTARQSGGLATPWDDDQSGFDQEWDDMLNQQSRRVRITFLPVNAPAAPAAASATGSAAGPAGSPPASAELDLIPDLREYTGPLRAEIDVVVLRTNRPNWRVQTKSVISSRFTRDPEMIERVGFSYDVPTTRDERLAARFADDLRDRLADKENAARSQAASGH